MIKINSVLNQVSRTEMCKGNRHISKRFHCFRMHYKYALNTNDKCHINILLSMIEIKVDGIEN